MSKNRESSFPRPEQSGNTEGIKKSSDAVIGTEHPDLINWRRVHNIKKAMRAAEEMAPDLEISDEADERHLFPDELALVDKVAKEIDRITGSEEEPQKK